MLDLFLAKTDNLRKVERALKKWIQMNGINSYEILRIINSKGEKFAKIEGKKEVLKEIRNYRRSKEIGLEFCTSESMMGG